MKKILTFLLLFLLAFSVFSVVSVQAQSGSSSPTIPPGTYVVEDGKATINGTTYTFRKPYGILRIGVSYRLDSFSNGEYSLSGGTANIDGFSVDFTPYASDGTVYVSGGDVVISTNSSNEPYTSPPSSGDISSSGNVTVNGMDFIVPGVESGTLETYSSRFEIVYSGGDFNVTYNASTDGFYARYASEAYGSSGPECVWSCVDPSRISGTMWDWFRSKNIHTSGWVNNPERLFSGDKDIYDNESEWAGEDFGTTGDPDPEEYINGSFGAHEGIHENTSSGPQYGKVDDDITSGRVQKPVFFSYLANDDNWENPKSLKGWNENAVRENITSPTKSTYPMEGYGKSKFDETGDVIVKNIPPSGSGASAEPGIEGAYVDIFSVSPQTIAYLNNNSLSCGTGSGSGSGGGGLLSAIFGSGGSSGSGNPPSGCGSGFDLTERRIRNNNNDIMVRYDGATSLPDDLWTGSKDMANCGSGNPPSDYRELWQNRGDYYINSDLKVEWVKLSAKTTVHDPTAEEDDKWGNNSSSPGYDDWYVLRNETDPGKNYHIFEDVSFDALGGDLNYTQSHWGVGHSIDSSKPSMKGAIKLNATVKLNATGVYEEREWEVKCNGGSVDRKRLPTSPTTVEFLKKEINVSDNEKYVIEEKPIVENVVRLNDEDKTYTHIDMAPLKYSNPRRMWNSIKRERVDKSTEYYGLTSDYVITGYYQFFSSRDKRWDKLQNLNYVTKDKGEPSWCDDPDYNCIGADPRFEREKHKNESGEISSDGGEAHRLVPVYQFAFPGADLALNGTPKTKVGYRWLGDSGYLSGYIGTPKLEKHKVCQRNGGGAGTSCFWLHLKDPRTNRTVKDIKYRDPSKFTFESTETYSTHWNENDNITRTSSPTWYLHPFEYNRSLKMERLVRGNDAKITPSSHATIRWTEFNAGTPEFEFSILSKGNVSNGTPTVINASVHPPICNTDPYSMYCREKGMWAAGFPTHIDLNKSNHGKLVIEEVSPRDAREYNETVPNDDLTNYSSPFRTEVEPTHKSYTYKIPANVEKVRLRYTGSNWQDMGNVWHGYATLRYLAFPWVRDELDYPQYTVLARQNTCTVRRSPCPSDKRVRWEDEYPWVENSQTFTVKETRFSSITDVFVTITRWAFGLIIVILIFGYLYTRLLRGGSKRR